VKSVIDLSRVFFIAEAGVNHNGDLALAKRLVEIAAKSGADAVKFQTFDASELATIDAGKAEYQNLQTGDSTQREMLAKLALRPEDFLALQKHCAACNIIFMSSAFDMKSVEVLANLNMSIWKIPSGEITNLPYLRKVGGLKKQVILSTGMATMSEIGEALGVLVSAGTEKSRITVLQCTTQYPADLATANLKAMQTIQKEFSVDVGYSDHTEGLEASLAAVALGARVIEKHFTLDRTLPGPDHKASLVPEELNRLVDSIRKVELALGSSAKQPTQEELKNKPFARKSIVALRKIKAGEMFSEANLTAKRPGTGLSPMRWDEVIGRKSPRDFNEDELITL
jgi:N,N'-diacetyllegionaminate synthase